MCEEGEEFSGNLASSATRVGTTPILLRMVIIFQLRNSLNVVEIISIAMISMLGGYVRE